MKKIHRQLAIFHIFLTSKVIEFDEITGLMDIGHRTILRDIAELQNAGLLKVRFSKKEKGYIHSNDHCRCSFSTPVYSAVQAKNMHLDRLIRLAKIMIHLKGHTERSCWDIGYSNDQQTCTSWYRQNFPNASVRTMQRDFADLNKIGYSIRYEFYEKCYFINFPDDIDGLIM